MAYSEELAERVRDELGPRPGVSERAMFGGLAFMVDGHMACGIVGDQLMVRVGADAHDAALSKKHVKPMDFTGKPMRGLVYVEAAGLKGAALGRWINQAVEYAAGLPPKKAKAPTPRGRAK